MEFLINGYVTGMKFHPQALWAQFITGIFRVARPPTLNPPAVYPRVFFTSGVPMSWTLLPGFIFATFRGPVDVMMAPRFEQTWIPSDWIGRTKQKKTGGKTKGCHVIWETFGKAFDNWITVDCLVRTQEKMITSPFFWWQKLLKHGNLLSVYPGSPSQPNVAP